MKSKTAFGVDPTLGRVDIQLSCLKNEKKLSGWFPLRQSSSSSVISDGPNVEMMSGSIKLSIQWIHSIKGLATHYFETLQR